MRLKNKTLMGGSVSAAVKLFRHDKNVRREFEDWMYRESGIKKPNNL